MNHFGWRLAVALYLSVMLIVILVHYPFGGYTASRDVVIRVAHGKCPVMPSIENVKSMPTEELRDLFDRSKLCEDETESRIMSPLDWRSEEPLIRWFGPFKNVLLVVVLITIAAGIWLWAFSKKDDRTNEA